MIQKELYILMNLLFKNKDIKVLPRDFSHFSYNYIYRYNN